MVLTAAERSARHYQKHRITRTAKAREKYAQNREAEVARSLEWNRNNRDRVVKNNRKSSLKKLYGLTELDYELGVAACGGRCEICGEIPDGQRHEGRLHVDHVRGTKFVRGLLCGRCNRGVGNFKDSPELLRRAAEYLEQQDNGLQAKDGVPSQIGRGS